MKRLYCVTVEHEMMVMAEDVAEAERLGSRYAAGEEPSSVAAYEVTRTNHLDGYARRSSPWGTDDDRTVQQIIDAMPE